MAELHLIHGSDEALVGQAATELVRRLVGSADRSLMVADLTLDGEDVTVGHVVAEAQTPPFLTDTRVVVMAILHSHYGRLLRLEGSGAHDEASAGAVLGIKGFAARKAVERARAMGPDAIHSAIQLLAQADMDLRGQRELPEGAVLEVLVARLCRLSATRRTSAAPAARLAPAQASVAVAFISRLLRRAAWFLWMMPFAAAWSRRFWATWRVASPSSVPTAQTAVLILVLSSERAALLRSARLALVMIRFFWLLMFATGWVLCVSRARKG
jgi:hypothetical protein